MIPSLVYLGYPSLSSSPPLWVEKLCEEEQSSEDFPYMFYLSGGVPTPRVLSTIDEGSAYPCSSRLCDRLSHTSLARFTGPLFEKKLSDVSSLAQESPNSTEFRLLLDLWLLSRASAYVVDTDILGYGRCGIEVSYAGGSMPTIGVSDRSVVDPWYQYHVDCLVKSSKVLSSLAAFVPFD